MSVTVTFSMFLKLFFQQKTKKAAHMQSHEGLIIEKFNQMYSSIVPI